MEKIKKGIKILKEEGVIKFIKELLNFFLAKFNQIFSRIFRKFIIKQIKEFNKDSIEDVFDFSYNLFLGVIRPIQLEDEFKQLLEIFKNLQPKVILEIGTANGGTLFCFCKLAPEDATIISIDLPGGPFGGGYPEWKIPIYQAFAKPGQKLYLLREDSHKQETLEKLKQILNDKQIDFLFIDGDHTYQGVKQDFEMYSPLVKEGGVIAFHDISDIVETDVVKVPKFWKEIKHYFNHQEIKQGGYGIGIIFK